MLIDQYYNETDNTISFTRQQGSSFAKTIAGDFNPLHDTDNNKFCVPGDLLFAVILKKYGISQQMTFTFSGMVKETVHLILPKVSNDIALSDAASKNYINVKTHGEVSHNASLIDSLTKNYVEFSGHTFPHILVPLLKEQGAMINPARPMVIYQKMLIHLESLDINHVNLELDTTNTLLELNGKRGNVCLAFKLYAEGEQVGHGEKHMVLSGLKPFEAGALEQLILGYKTSKQD